MSTADRRDLALSFNRSAAGYQNARPDYPDELYTDLIRTTGLRPGDRSVEIGCGPGKATVAMARRGLRITALEPGPELAEQARINLAGTDAEVITTTFEDWQPDRTGDYALAYAATAWHWLDPEVRWSKVASVVADGGHLAVFGAGHAFPEGFDPFFTEIQQTYEDLGERVEGWPPPTPDQLPDPSPEYQAAGYVVDDVRRYVWSLTYDAESYIALLRTFSGHILMPVDKRQRLFARIRRLLAERPDGLLTRHWVSTLVICHPA
ncbi:methyltransferase domain-containing protein [Microlunatus sp. Gsoil 973]|uniref:class I SAM-dependent methyltransferase n=1 Tax=Microlunatus sp. Gsoil 973 TaxID=2672569 RepID=UPI0012B4801C|nr:methyltransferase domain-containing protein [Microlunatus sp. Gsoil 973]QGN31713.1 methyltransferase domain-containing protein [Microlunatus sp. Gsoil 973]